MTQDDLKLGSTMVWKLLCEQLCEDVHGYVMSRHKNDLVVVKEDHHLG